MSTITLPSPRRAQLQAFWLVQSACIGLLAIIVLRILNVPRHLFWGTMLALLLAVCGLFGQRVFVAKVYRTWDRCSEMYALAARKLLVRICYFVIFTVVGWTGSSMRGNAKSKSLWVPRTTLPASTYGSQYDLALPDVSHWSTNYFVCAYKSGNVWAWGLFPFLVMIAALDIQESRTYPTSIYTLF